MIPGRDSVNDPGSSPGLSPGWSFECWDLFRANKEESLSVFRSLGREVAVLVEEEKAAGYHEAVFGQRSTVDRLPSGVYFYRMSVKTAGGERFERVRKMVLMK